MWTIGSHIVRRFVTSFQNIRLRASIGWEIRETILCSVTHRKPQPYISRWMAHNLPKFRNKWQLRIAENKTPPEMRIMQSDWSDVTVVACDLDCVCFLGCVAPRSLYQIKCNLWCSFFHLVRMLHLIPKPILLLQTDRGIAVSATVSTWILFSLDVIKFSMMLLNAHHVLRDRTLKCLIKIEFCWFSYCSPHIVGIVCVWIRWSQMQRKMTDGMNKIK